jgi:flagellar protein FliO/FliZ
MLEYFVRVLVLVPLIGGLAWGSLWLWKRTQLGLPVRYSVKKPIQIVDVLTLGTSGKLAVITFHGKTLLVAATRQGIALVAASDAGATDVE